MAQARKYGAPSENHALSGKASEYDDCILYKGTPINEATCLLWVASCNVGRRDPGSWGFQETGLDTSDC